MEQFRLNIAVEGKLDDENSGVIRKKLFETLVVIKTVAGGLTGNEVSLNVIASHNKKAELEELFSGTENVSVIECPFSAESGGMGSDMLTWVYDKADIGLIVWNEKFDGSAAINLLQTAKYNRTPCIWISSVSSNEVYWSLDSYYDKFSQDKFRDYISSLINLNAETDEEEQRVPLIGPGRALYDRFIKKYKAKTNPTPFENDEMLSDKTFFEDDENAEKLRKDMVEHFNRYDRKAVDQGEKYKSTIYLRSILPFAATIVLAVGFYIESIFGKPLDHMFGVPIWIWTALAGVGFFLHAGVNFYSYILSGNKQVHRWHREFIHNRHMAEFMRLMVHFLPFGLTMNIRNILEKCGGTSEQKRVFYAHTRNILRDNDRTDIPYSEEKARKALKSLMQMAQDQKIYHENCVKRYDYITEALQKMQKIAFRAGFVLVIARGVLQLLLCFPAINSGLDSALSGFVGDPTSFTRSFLNMFALITPAVASYFSSKISLCGFSELRDESRAMKERLEDMTGIIEKTLQRDELPFELMHTISDDICIAFLDDRLAWNANISERKVSQI